MTTYPTALFLAAGDTLTASGGDYVPSSGDYINLMDPLTTLCLEGGLIIPPSKQPAGQKTAGAMVRVRAVRSQPVKTITLHIIIKGGGTDATSPRVYWRNIEHKLEQAAAAAGPFGHGTNICLLVRFATGSSASSLGANFTAYDVVRGIATQNDLLTSPGQAYGMTLELECLMYGRLTAQTYPGVNTFTAISNVGLASYWFLGTGTSGPIPGHIGALAQVHIKDTSTGGHAINRVRIGRRNVPGASGGMATGDFVPVMAVNAAIGSGSLTSSTPGTQGTVGTSWATATLIDANWHSICRWISNPGGTAPLHEDGLFDVYARVRESSVVAVELTAPTISNGVSGAAIPADVYNLAWVGKSGSSASAIGPITQWQVPAAAVFNIFDDGFESGDTSAFTTSLSIIGTGVDDASTGQMQVGTQYAIAGNYGLRVGGAINYSSELSYAGSSGSYIQTPFRQQVLKSFINPSGNKPCCGAWFRLAGALSQSNAEIQLMALESSQLVHDNTIEGWSGSGASQVPSYNANGLYGGFAAEVVFSNGTLYLRSWTTAGALTFVSTSLTLTQILNQPIYLELILSASTVTNGSAYTAYLNVYHGSTVTSVSAASNLTIGVSAQTYTIDQATWGMRTYFSCSAEIDIDDCAVWTQAGTATQAPSTPPLVATPTNPDTSTPDLWVQQGSGPWYRIAAPTTPYTVTAGDLNPNNIVSPPAIAIPNFSSFQAYYGVNGAAQRVQGPLMQGTIGGNAWYLLFLGTMPLPSANRFEGLNPSGGSGAGQFPWAVDLYVQNGAGTTSNTVQADGIFLMPHDEPQVLATFTALNNTTPYEWVIDLRRDGRVGCVLRDIATFSIIEAQCEAIGHLELGPGNQTLVFLVERENGLHDVTNNAYSVCMRYQPLVDFVDDSPTAY